MIRRWIVGHVLAWSVTGATTLTVAQIVTPTIVDWMFKIIIVGLIFAVVKISKLST